MRSASSGHVTVGATSALLGAAAIAAGFARVGPLAGDFLNTPNWALAITGGSVLVLAGVLIVAFTVRRPEEPEPEVPAHVAFRSRMTIVDAIAPLPRPTGARAPSPTAASAPRLPAPPPAQQRRVAAPRDDLLKIDAEIRALTKKINKAGVMLATGQLSQQGYLAYVEDMKRTRGALEAQRVRAELHNS